MPTKMNQLINLFLQPWGIWGVRTPARFKDTSTPIHLAWSEPTRGSAITEEPRDALRQLKYYGRFLTELLTRCSANPEASCEHTVSWNRVKCCTNVQRIACKNVCNRWVTFKVIQGHCRCHHLIGHILFPISLSSVKTRIRDTRPKYSSGTWLLDSRPRPRPLRSTVAIGHAHWARN